MLLVALRKDTHMHTYTNRRINFKKPGVHRSVASTRQV